MDEQIRYQFARFKEFFDDTKQRIMSEPEEQIPFLISKSTFVRNSSLGNVSKPLRKLRRRLEKHFRESPALLDHCWKELKSEMVEMVKEVEGWRDRWYENVEIRPDSNKLEYEMNNLGRSI